ncbi:gliding motility-associated C-terminal domain-containing protein [Hymenobacter sp. BT664]|uniref:Gliding motility-associated C-terminal domain-containing protein n=1 Tax=Hymenobacter montanus TaxID=2771359 RepID=A0A927BDB3_9BACT|nr:gliding motility-associated C-terminal domain-containing protein [Hymenobacter montanus]MBD2768014.1 gliding motility-associated C-terminal domain-containing protein [Hymenobacter montanus]
MSRLLSWSYTPAPGVDTVTVWELVNEAGRRTYYIRKFRVYDTPAPAFTLVPCVGNLVQVTVTDATYDSYEVQVGTGAFQRIDRNLPTTLSGPAGSPVTVLGSYSTNGACKGSNRLTIPTLAPPQTPLFTSLALAAPLPGSPATLEVGQLPPGYRYTLQAAEANAPGGYRDVANVPAGTSSFSLPSTQKGCYRLLRSDFCENSKEFSSSICTLSLTGSSAGGRNQLQLDDAGVGATYSVTRDNVTLPNASLIPISGGLEDPNVECGTTYTYRVTATQTGGGTAISNPVSITTRSTIPPPRPLLVASFNLRNVLELTALTSSGVPLPKGGTLRYRRAAGGQPPVDFGTVASTRVRRDSADLAGLLAQPPCYTMVLTDLCGNAAPESSAACPALLTARAADAEGTTVALSWTPFTGPAPNATTYTLQRLARDGSVLSTVPIGSGTTYTDFTPPADQQRLRYRLLIQGAGLPAGRVSYSNLATVTRRITLAIPTAFTPNGDGLNDLLEVKGRYLRNYLFVVVDRNGQEVFRSTQRDQVWDGTIRGQPPVLGAYAWRFQQESEEGPPFTATGSVTILK